MTVVQIREAGFGPVNSAQLPGLGHKSNIRSGDDYAITLDTDSGMLSVVIKKIGRTLIVPQGVWLWVDIQPKEAPGPALKK